jgi:pimeloyl-ACP methyl ester carboxylesterase
MDSLPTPRRVTLAAPPGIGGEPLDPITLSVYAAGPEASPAVVLCHGFPDLACSWRRQIEALSEAGFRVLAPDQRGYGASDCPAATEAYDLEHLTGDLVGLLDAHDIERAVFAGHDWGGFVVWAMAVLHPERTAGVIGVNTPYLAFPKMELLRQLVPDEDKLYVLWFQKPGVAEQVLDRDPRLCFERLMRGGFEPEGGLLERATAEGAELDANPFRRLEDLPSLGEALLDEAELEFYTKAFLKTGFRGGISWYRNIDRNSERFPQIGVQKLDLPCLMVTADWDLALRPEMAAGMPALCSDLEMKGIAECGHWTPREKPEELNRLMLDWLKRRFT